MKLNYAALILGRILSNSSSKFKSKSSTFAMASLPSDSYNVRHHIRFFSVNRIFDFGLTPGYVRTILLFQEMLETQPWPSADDFNAKLRSVVRMGRLAPAFQLFDEMLRRDAPVNRFTLNIAIKCCCGLGRVDLGFSILGRFFKCGDGPNVETFAALMKGFLSAGEIRGAMELWRKLLDEQPSRPDEAAYNLAMIRGLCRGGHTLVALELLDTLENGDCKPDLQAYTAVIHRLCKDCMVDDALRLFSSLGDVGVSPNVKTYSLMINGLCGSGRWSEADGMLKEMAAKNVCPNLLTYNVLLNALCKSGRVEEAENVMGNMEHVGVKPDVTTYNMLMHAYCLKGDMDKAENVLDIAVESGTKPDVISYGTLMNGYCKMDRLDGVWRLFTIVVAEGLEHDVVSCSIMLHALFRGGRFEEGLKLFEEMEGAPRLPLGISSYNVLMDGLCSAHRVDKAFSVMRAVEEKGIVPDIVTYNTLITGLCSEDRVRMAKQVFQQLPIIGMRPNVVTYTGLIGALCRVGEADEAKKLFVQMGRDGCFPNSITYNTFLRGLVKCNKVHDAVLLLDEMKARGFALDPATSSTVLKHIRAVKTMMRVVRSGSQPKPKRISLLVSPLKNVATASAIFDFVAAEKCQKSKIFSIAWSPDSTRIRSKTICASSKDRFTRELDEIHVDLIQLQWASMFIKSHRAMRAKAAPEKECL